ncbi:MAG: hypothetical protein IH623_30710 [Verrucomicrobia bacterium]|nr:hypothetical protein [Verrucomicrobiota bacterium]
MNTLDQSTQPVFTANEFAGALGKTKRALLTALQSVPASGNYTVRGQSAKAWALADLPPVLSLKLEHSASRQNFRSPEQMLFHRRAQAEARANVPSTKPGLNPSSERPELAAAFRELRFTLDEARECLSSEMQPTFTDREFLWTQICDEITRLELQDGERAPAKRFVLNWLQTYLPNFKASLRTLERKLADPDSRTDARRQRSGNHREILCPACWEKALRLNQAYAGRESHAWRELKLKKQLCPECDARHNFDVRRDKSRVPNSIRRASTPITDKAQDFTKSESAGRMAGPKMNQTHDHYHPGEWFVADDVSWNHKVWTAADDGTPYLCRPECLYLADERTSYPIHFLLIPGSHGQKASYNASHVRLLMLQAHDLLGLPDRGFIFENGAWRARTVHDGRAGASFMPWAETETGFKHLKHFVEIRHTRARTPTGKPTIENDFRILQERMRREPGFVGFNQRNEQSDRSKRLERDFARRVKAGQEHPGNEYFSLGQFKDRLSEILLEYANEPQNGKRLPGISPAEAWGTPTLRRLGEDERWTLASNYELKRVESRGLVIKGRNYANGELARYLGQQVWAFYNLEYPQLLTVCDQKRTHYFSVPELTAPARTASETPEGRAALARSMKAIADFNRPAKVIAGSIKHPVVRIVTRDTDTDETHRAMGRQIKADVATHRASQRTATDARTKRRNEGRKLMAEAMMESGLQDSNDTSL